MDYEPLYHAPQIREAYACIFGVFYFYFSLFFYIVGAFFIKQLALVGYEMIIANEACTISFPTPARGMIVDYFIVGF